MTAEERARAMMGQAAPLEHWVQRPLALTDEELAGARREGISLAEAEAHKAKRLGEQHGLTPAQVRAAVAVGMGLGEYREMAGARSIGDYTRARERLRLEAEAQAEAEHVARVERARRQGG